MLLLSVLPPEMAKTHSKKERIPSADLRHRHVRLNILTGLNGQISLGHGLRSPGGALVETRTGPVQHDTVEVAVPTFAERD